VVIEETVFSSLRYRARPCRGRPFSFLARLLCLSVLPD
jgi:hypothetical protein